MPWSGSGRLATAFASHDFTLACPGRVAAPSVRLRTSSTCYGDATLIRDRNGPGSATHHRRGAASRPGQELLYLLHLRKFQLDRRGAAEDRHRDLDPRAALVDLLDGAV